jgi:hypothetical protein
VFRWADSGQLQLLRRTDGARAQHGIPLHTLRLQVAVDDEVHCDTPTILDAESVYQCVVYHVEVGPIHRWHEIGVCRALADPIHDVHFGVVHPTWPRPLMSSVVG